MKHRGVSVNELSFTDMFTNFNSIASLLQEYGRLYVRPLIAITATFLKSYKIALNMKLFIVPIKNDVIQ